MSNFWQKLQKPFTVLAPMDGVTDYVFREIVATELPKPSVIFTEFTNVDALNSDGFENTIQKFKFSKNQRPIVAQIWGSKPENYYKSAKIVKDLGFDGIDINMGCPVREVVKIGSGSALIDNQNLVREIVAAAKDGAGDMPVSVKTRLGFKKDTSDTWIPFLLSQKLDALTIHFRTAKEMSKGEPHWERAIEIIKVRNEISPKTLIVGNGDVLSMKEVGKLHSRYKVDGVMIGRGIFKNPWVFEENYKKHTKEEYINVLLKHLDLCEKTWGEDPKRFSPMKKFFKMYINGFKGSAILRQKLMETGSYGEVRKLLKTKQDGVLPHPVS